MSPSTTRSTGARPKAVARGRSPPRATSTDGGGQQEDEGGDPAHRDRPYGRPGRDGVGTVADSSRSLRWDDAVLHMAETKRKRPRLKDLPGGQVTELIVIVVDGAGDALVVQWLLVKPYKIPSGSMEPTLDVGQRVLVNRLSHRQGSDPQVGDIVSFHRRWARTGRRRAAARSRPTTSRAPRRAEQLQQTFIKRWSAWAATASPSAAGTSCATVKRQSEPFIAECAGGQGVRLAARDHRPAAATCSHGRQPRRVRRRGLLGADTRRTG